MYWVQIKFVLHVPLERMQIQTVQQRVHAVKLEHTQTNQHKLVLLIALLVFLELIHYQVQVFAKAVLLVLLIYNMVLHLVPCVQLEHIPSLDWLRVDQILVFHVKKELTVILQVQQVVLHVLMATLQLSLVPFPFLLVLLVHLQVMVSMVHVYSVPLEHLRIHLHKLVPLLVNANRVQQVP